MITVVTVVGARPQFVKAAPVSRALRARATEVLVHTGQHYDAAMSDVFFAELDLPQPDVNLGIGSGPHGRQTGAMLAAIEAVLVASRPAWLLVYGDTNSTLAGALAAVKLGIPVAHVEAGLRSFNWAMPEEHNRRLTDHCASLLFCPTQTAVANLRREGIDNGVHLVGDVMFDAVRHFGERAAAPDRRRALGIDTSPYALLTVHRPANADDPRRLRAILDGAARLDIPVVFPVHPRTREALAALDHPAVHLDTPADDPAAPQSGDAQRPIRCRPPVGYLDMLALESNARVILTDSGGVQKEAYFCGVPCVTLRAETEWVETLDDGWNVLADADPVRIAAAARRPLPSARPAPVFGDGHAAVRIVDALLGAPHAER